MREARLRRLRRKETLRQRRRRWGRQTLPDRGRNPTPAELIYLIFTGYLLDIHRYRRERCKIAAQS
jgi:hypothetical protein